MKTTLATPFVLAAATAVAFADPVLLSDIELASVRARGGHFVLTPGQSDGSFHISQGRVDTGTVVFPDQKDASGFTFVQTPGQPTGRFVTHNGQVQRSTNIDFSALP